jgi:cell division protease FtsH
MVDDEVKRMIDEAYEKARVLLSENRELLDRMALALLDRETIDREDVDLLSAGKPLPPRTAHQPLPPYPAPAAAGKPEAAPARPPILGAPPAEPAGA